MVRVVAIAALLCAMIVPARADALTPEQASRLAGLALACIGREFPNKVEHVINDMGDVSAPRQLHPAFYGCVDWHSAVHGHWMLVRVLQMFPHLPEADRVRAAIDQNLTKAKITAELAYFQGPHRESFERTYGWAWLLELAHALHGWDDPDGKRWAEAVQPLADEIAARYRMFLPKQTYPIRTGVHGNTAFGLAFALDYARAVGDQPLADLIVERAMAYYGNDADAPVAWEPGGEDFLSPALVEADLMRRVLPASKLAPWLHRFLPRWPKQLAQPAIVTDRSDPKLAHLDGLNLSRAWCLRSLAAALPANDALRVPIAASADAHANEGLAHVATGDYMGEHWLASFAIYLLRTPAPSSR
jgi:hypothetical protein